MKIMLTLSLGLFISLTAAARAQGPTLLWSSEEIQLRQEAGRSTPPVVTALVVHAGGHLMATAGDDHLVRLWKLPSGELSQRLEGHTDWVRTLAFSPGGETLYSAGNDRRILAWNLEDGSYRQLAELEIPVTILAVSPDGQWIAAAGFGNRLHLISLSESSPGAGGAISADGHHQLECPCDDMRALAFSADGQLLASGGRNGIIRIWNTSDASICRQYEAHRGRIRSLLFAGPSPSVVSCGEDRRVHVRSLQAIGADDISADLPDRPCKILAMTMWGDWLATGGSDNRIRLWDLAQNAEVAVMEGHLGSVAALDSTVDFLISGSFDTTVRLWSMTNEVSTTR